MARQRVDTHGDLIKCNLKVGHDVSQVCLQHWSTTVDLVQLMWHGVTATRNQDDHTMQTNSCGHIDFLDESLGPNLHDLFLDLPRATRKSLCEFKLLFFMLKHKVMHAFCPFWRIFITMAGNKGFIGRSDCHLCIFRCRDTLGILFQVLLKKGSLKSIPCIPTASMMLLQENEIDKSKDGIQWPVFGL